MNPILNVTNTPLARAFRQIVTAGWSEQSDGDVNSPTGHFALIPVPAADLPELIDAVFDGEYPGVDIEAGYYLLVEDSDGNSNLVEYLTEDEARAAYKELSEAFDVYYEGVES